MLEVDTMIILKIMVWGLVLKIACSCFENKEVEPTGKTTNVTVKTRMSYVTVYNRYKIPEVVNKNGKVDTLALKKGWFFKIILIVIILYLASYLG
jgi:hypothetical protein